jgi:hypothetical protein
MYQPGGARFGSAGTVTCTLPAAWAAMGRSTSRWLVLNEWVVDPGRIRLTHCTCPASGEEMFTVCP